LGSQYLDEEKFLELKANLLAKYLPTKESTYWLSDENHYRADFAEVKDKNPLNINNTKAIEGGMLKGKWFNRDKLDAMLLEVEMSND
jgi:hypothetical protein